MSEDWKKWKRLRRETKVEVIPGILATDESEYKGLVEALNGSEALADGWVQLDLMDGVFVDNKSVDLGVIQKYPLNFKVEAQLMAEYPDNWIDDLVKIGTKRVIFPVEDSAGIDERIKHLRNHGLEVGLSINPETSVETLTQWLGKIDRVLVMSVHPGFGGQEFLKESIDKVVAIRRMSADVKIEVDGGVSVEVVTELARAGADAVVIGAKRLIEEGIDETFEQIWESFEEEKSR